MSRSQTTAGSERRYPRTCAHCGATFVAARSHARWCSGRCRLRAWRAERKSLDGLDDGAPDAGLAARVRALQAALEVAQSAGVCAQQGCRLLTHHQAKEAIGEGEERAAISPWRDGEWDHPSVQRLRARLSEQAEELDRLREENALLRRWVSEHRHSNPVDGQGA
jgi:ribosomal protein S27AE